MNNQIQLISRHMAVESYIQVFVSGMVIHYLSSLLEYELTRADTKCVYFLEEGLACIRNWINIIARR